MKLKLSIWCVLSVWCLAVCGTAFGGEDTAAAKVDSGKAMSVGVFIGKIEEGARIFTPIRLIPKWHPGSLSHEFPNALQLHQNEFDALVYIGKLCGLGLRATLLRYPKEPTSEWEYTQFPELPVDAIKAAAIHHAKRSDTPVPGVRVVAYVGGEPLGWIVDTRDLTLEERGMERATTAGLDMPRAEFLDGLRKGRELVSDDGDVIVVFDEE